MHKPPSHTESDSPSADASICAGACRSVAIIASAGAGNSAIAGRVHLIADGCGSFRVTDGSGPERVLALRCAGVEPLVLAGEVEGPVFVEVAVADHRAQGEDGFGAVQAPPCPGDVEPVADQVAAGSLDDPGRDGPARGEGLV